MPPGAPFQELASPLTASFYDNLFVQHPIPQGDRDYSWIKASMLGAGYDGFDRLDPISGSAQKVYQLARTTLVGPEGSGSFVPEIYPFLTGNLTSNVGEKPGSSNGSADNNLNSSNSVGNNSNANNSSDSMQIDYKASSSPVGKNVVGSNAPKASYGAGIDMRYRDIGQGETLLAQKRNAQRRSSA